MSVERNGDAGSTRVAVASTTPKTGHLFQCQVKIPCEAAWADSGEHQGGREAPPSSIWKFARGA
jgi:hypothetical protein